MSPERKQNSGIYEAHLRKLCLFTNPLLWKMDSPQKKKNLKKFSSSLDVSKTHSWKSILCWKSAIKFLMQLYTIMVVLFFFSSILDIIHLLVPVFFFSFFISTSVNMKEWVNAAFTIRNARIVIKCKWVIRTKSDFILCSLFKWINKFLLIILYSRHQFLME